MQDEKTTEATPAIAQYKHGEQLLETCDKCEGCGRIANDEEGAPWRDYQNMVPGSDATVSRFLNKKPIICPKCGGLGKVVISK